jgi:lipoprotein NlpI
LLAANDANANNNKQLHCEVDFYLGEDALLRGQHEDAISFFRDTLATGVTTFVEYEGAKAELRHMQVPSSSRQ